MQVWLTNNEADRRAQDSLTILGGSEQIPLALGKNTLSHSQLIKALSFYPLQSPHIHKPAIVLQGVTAAYGRAYFLGS